MTVKERHYWKFIKQILFLLNYILFIIKICQMCKIKSHWMFSVVFFMFYICVICDCVCVQKYAIYLIWPRQFSFGPDSSHLAHVFLIWLIPWPEQKMSQRGPCISWFFFLSNFQALNVFVIFFSGTVRPIRLKLGTHVNNGWGCCCLFILLFFFIFFLSNYQAWKCFVGIFLGTIRHRRLKFCTNVNSGCMYCV